MICKTCKKIEAVTGITKCQPCRTRYNVAVRKYQLKMRGKGLCISCQAPLNKYKWMCDSCGERNIENGRKLSDHRKALGVCRECPSVVMKNKKICIEHYFKEVASRAFDTTTRYLDLIDLFTLQDAQCYLCKNIMDLEDKLELDHKNPISRFPEQRTNISNLAWMCKDCNQSKRNMTVQEYIDHCKKVVLAN